MYCFCLQLGKMSHIYQKEFETINWLPLKKDIIVHKSTAFKYFDNQFPHYLNEVFMKARESSSSLRNSYQKRQQPFHKTNTGQNAFPFISLPDALYKAGLL